MYMNVASAIPPPTPSTVGMSGYVGSSRAKQLMEFYPPPYGFAAGMGHCCASCASGGTCEGHGMGLFDSGTDISGWGWPEWSIVALGGLIGFNFLRSVARTGRSATKGIKRYRRRAAKRRALKQQVQQTGWF